MSMRGKCAAMKYAILAALKLQQQAQRESNRNSAPTNTDDHPATAHLAVQPIGTGRSTR
jgi:hypothetical protein